MALTLASQEVEEPADEQHEEQLSQEQYQQPQSYILPDEVDANGEYGMALLPNLRYNGNLLLNPLADEEFDIQLSEDEYRLDPYPVFLAMPEVPSPPSRQSQSPLTVRYETPAHVGKTSPPHAAFKSEYDLAKCTRNKPTAEHVAFVEAYFSQRQQRRGRPPYVRVSRAIFDQCRVKYDPKDLQVAHCMWKFKCVWK